MKQTRRIYENYLAYRKTGENKASYSSLQKYNRSPYLQKVVNQSTAKKKIPDDLQSKHQKQYSEPSEKSAKGEEQLGKSIVPISQNRNYLQSYQLPKIGTSKFKQGQLKAKLEGGELLTNRQKLSVGSHSATLEVATKKKKLQPLSKPYKINAISKTKAGTTGKQTKINQDVAIIQNKLSFGLRLYCVCDGHGLNGHTVSAFIKSHLISNLQLKQRENVTAMLKKNNSTPPPLQSLKEILRLALEKTNQMLLESDINTELSGSTVVAVFIYQETIICYNIGDSRAILVSQVKKEFDEIDEEKQNESYKKFKSSYGSISQKYNLSNYDWLCKPLSIDQKPERQDQKQRILKFGGRIFSQKTQKGEQIGPLRVWMKDVQMPGLAMTRSFGDKAGIKSGTNAIPEIIEHSITDKDKFIVVASDGVWQYLENEQVMNIIIPFFMHEDIDLGAERVLKIATEIWTKVSLSRDDITLIIVALNSPNQ